MLRGPITECAPPLAAGGSIYSAFRITPNSKGECTGLAFHICPPRQRVLHCLRQDRFG
jgi:hypothetical protein